MHIIKPDSMPRFWWLFPWTVCRQLHKNAVALRSLCDRQDAVIRELRKQVASLCLERIAQKPTDDFTAYMVKLKDEHMNVNEFTNYPNNTSLPR
jgi:hypothetical protein